ncbi:hypothetical protein [Chlamydia felis Fe/C-56]|uniref:Uncharacterized protein n=1 Tax=Chlamydia felis (strain Fe/C-56) TaxID=264202 RepID=Q253T3_CHLFF|nr:hypothetical protein [Chlamydia felis Fe/C-56]
MKLFKIANKHKKLTTSFLCLKGLQSFSSIHNRHYLKSARTLPAARKVLSSLINQKTNKTPSQEKILEMLVFQIIGNKGDPRVAIVILI